MSESLHEELLSAFMASAESTREVAAANEIERLQKENAALKRDIAKLKEAPKVSRKDK